MHVCFWEAGLSSVGKHPNPIHAQVVPPFSVPLWQMEDEPRWKKSRQQTKLTGKRAGSFQPCQNPRYSVHLCRYTFILKVCFLKGHFLKNGRKKGCGKGKSEENSESEKGNGGKPISGNTFFWILNNLCIWRLFCLISWDHLLFFVTQTLSILSFFWFSNIFCEICGPDTAVQTQVTLLDTVRMWGGEDFGHTTKRPCRILCATFFFCPYVCVCTHLRVYVYLRALGCRRVSNWTQRYCTIQLILYLPRARINAWTEPWQGANISEMIMLYSADNC